MTDNVIECDRVVILYSNSNSVVTFRTEKAVCAIINPMYLG